VSKHGFRELEVWRKAKKLAKEIHGLTNRDLLAKDRILKDQMWRADVGKIDASDAGKFIEACDEVGRMLRALIVARSKKKAS